MSKATTSTGTGKRIGPVKGLALMLASLLVVFLIFEIGTRVWLGFFASDEQLARYGSAEQIANRKLKYARHHYLPFTPTPDYEHGNNRHDSHGFRGDEVQIPKPEGTFRIVLLGGSTTYTTGIDDYRKSYPYLLQSLLRESNSSVEVINAGSGRYSTWESVLNLVLRVMDTEPDLVIVYHGQNDVHTRLVYPFDAYQGDNSGARRPFVPPRDTGFRRSAFLRAVATKTGFRKPLSGLLFTRTHDWLPTNHTSEFRQQVLAKTYPSGVFAEVDVAGMLARNKPRFFTRNLENIIALCKFHGIETVFMTFAASPEFPQFPTASSAEYQGAIQEQNEIVRGLCQEHGVPCHDFATEMPPDAKYWTDGVHVNEEGAQVKARLVADFLTKSGLLPAQ